jgi:hypothetical protein
MKKKIGWGVWTAIGIGIGVALGVAVEDMMTGIVLGLGGTLVIGWVVRDSKSNSDSDMDGQDLVDLDDDYGDDGGGD